MGRDWLVVTQIKLEADGKYRSTEGRIYSSKSVVLIKVLKRALSQSCVFCIFRVKMLFEKKNQKTNSTISQLQKKLGKYHRALVVSV